MIGSVTTAFCSTAKQELATGGHCFYAPNNQLGNSYGNATCNTFIIGLTNTAVLAVGMLVNACTNTTSTSNIIAQTVNAAGAVISHIINSTAVRIDLPWSTNTSVNVATITFAGDSSILVLSTLLQLLLGGPRRTVMDMVLLLELQRLILSVPTNLILPTSDIQWVDLH